jgi:hypothetical protein
MCIFSYWIYYVAPGCIIIHIPLATVGVCVDPCGGGQVGVAGNLQVRPLSILLEIILRLVVEN